MKNISNSTHVEVKSYDIVSVEVVGWQWQIFLGGFNDEKQGVIKALLGTVAVAFGLFGGVLLSQPATAQASSTFSRSTLNNPTGYYYTNKGQYAFRWASLKRSGKTYHFISMVNFKNGTVYTGGISRYEISRNRRTFTTTFKLYSNAGNLSSATYKFGLYKLSTSKYRVKLYTYKAGKLLSNKGTTYSITRTTKNPFSRLFDA